MPLSDRKGASVGSIDPMRRWLGGLAVVIIASGCATSPGQSPSKSQATTSAPTETGLPGPALHLVAIGDSIAASTLCACPRYPDVYAKLASAALGHPVLVQNLAKVATTSADWVDSLDSSRELQSKVKEADIITITIGINDLGRCGTEMDRACYASAIAGLKKNLEAILYNIDNLQGSHPYILRQTAYYNPVIGSSSAARLGPDYLAFYADQLRALNDTICAAIVAHNGACVELLTAFNGPAGDLDAGDLLVDDHVHPSRTGMETIAKQIAATGYAPLQP
jgi:lysophospholipase L1-like esterase